MDELILLQETRVVGRLYAEEIGAYQNLFAECRAHLDGIWRAYLVCEETEWLIGVLTPNENGIFCAKKRIAKTELPKLSLCHGVIRFGRSQARTGWVVCRSPQNVFRDPVLRVAMHGASGVLVDWNEKPRRVAMPLKNGCACAPALCLAHMMRYRGEEYAVFYLDENGNLVPNDGTKQDE